VAGWPLRHHAGSSAFLLCSRQKSLPRLPRLAALLEIGGCTALAITNKGSLATRGLGHATAQRRQLFSKVELCTQQPGSEKPGSECGCLASARRDQQAQMVRLMRQAPGP